MTSAATRPVDITLAGETVTLLAERALFWPATRTLLVADLHLGKDYVFGRQGIAIPAGSSEATLARLHTALTRCNATRLCILGDLVHAAPAVGESWLASLASLLDRHSGVAVDIIAGNHDRDVARERLDARLRWHDHPLRIGPFLLQHAPGRDADAHVIAGHRHPVYRLPGARRESGLRLPVFHVAPACTVLPAMGYFTGGQAVRPAPPDRLYLVADDGVIALPAPTTSTSGELPSDA